MKFTVSQVRIDAAGCRVGGQGRHEGRLGQQAGRLSAGNVKERLAHAGVALDANACSR